MGLFNRVKNKFRTWVFFCALSVFLVFGSPAWAAEIVARGSDSTIEAVKALTAAFKAKGGAEIKVEGGGSSKGAKDCLAGQVPLAFLSRGLKDKETKAGLVGVPYAIDGVAIIVNKANPIDNLSLEQLKAIYTGKMKQWPDGKPIVAFNRNPDSGTREVFQEKVLGKEKFAPNIPIKHDQALAPTISKVVTAMGYTSAGHAERETNLIKVVKVNGVEPTSANLRNKSYPLVRVPHFATKGQPTGDIKAFIDFAVSEEGQKVLQKVGLISLK
ncbi:MAG: phosphate ABC transporter substrate-binding protein [Thermodesulfobacteriota bacterium]